MVQMLELSDWGFEAPIIKMPRNLVNKVGNMQEKMDNENRKMEILRKNQKTEHIIILDSSLVHIPGTLPHNTTCHCHRLVLPVVEIHINEIYCPFLFLASSIQHNVNL